jgi:hypothetical protein
MKISRNDTFDLNLCIRGLGNLITHMHSDFYTYIYYLTFKRTLKSHFKDFNDPWEQEIEDIEFFKDIDDPFVQSCLEARSKLVEFKIDLMLRFGIDEEEDINDEVVMNQENRFKPYFLISKRSKSYKKLKMYYERTLSESIRSLYLYACAVTADSYKIPLILKRQLHHIEEDPLRLLNHDDNNVELLMQLILGLQKDLEIFQGLAAITSKVKRDRYYKECLSKG